MAWLYVSNNFPPHIFLFLLNGGSVCVIKPAVLLEGDWLRLMQKMMLLFLFSHDSAETGYAVSDIPPENQTEPTLNLSI